MNLLHLYKIFCIQHVTWLDNLLRNSNWITSISVHVDTRIPIHYHHHRASKFVIRMSADGFGMDSPLFQLHEAYAQVRHTECLVLSSFHRPARRCVHRGGYRHKITTLAPDLTGGGGAYGPAYITVAVGNRIHQIKSSIHLCGSGDSGGRVGGWERWRLT